MTTTYMIVIWVVRGGIVTIIRNDLRNTGVVVILGEGALIREGFQQNDSVKAVVVFAV